MFLNNAESSAYIYIYIKVCGTMCEARGAKTHEMKNSFSSTVLRGHYGDWGV